MKHPANLGWAQNLPDGYYLDDLRQVRHQETTDLVCGVSGRGHRHYLLPLAVPEPGGTIRLIWVDRQTMQELGRTARRAARKTGSRGLRNLFRRLLREGLGLLAGKARV